MNGISLPPASAYTPVMFSGESVYWLGWLGAVIVMISMVILAWWALFSDRPRGRRRCPNCWYDMSYSPGMSCSECGFTASEEKQFYRTRRRYGYAALAVLTCMIVVYNVRHMAFEHGLVSLMPTRALTLAMAFTDDPYGAVFSEIRRRFNGETLSDGDLRAVINRCVKGDWQATPTNELWRDTYGNLLLSWRFDLSMMARRAEDPDRAELLREIENRLVDIPVHAQLMTRQTWPRQVPAVALLRIEEWWPLGSMMRVHVSPTSPEAPRRVFYQSNLSFARSGFAIPLGILDAHASDIVVDVRVDWRHEEESEWKQVWTGQLSSPVRVEGDVADAIEGVNTPQQMTAMRETFRGDLRRWSHGRSPLRFFYRPGFTHAPAFDDVAIGLSVALLHDDQVVRELHMWWMGGRIGGNQSQRNLGWEIVYEDLDAIESISPDEPGWTFTVEGRPDIALRAGEMPQYWNGSFTVPVRFVHSRGEAPPPDWWTDDDDQNHDAELHESP